MNRFVYIALFALVIHQASAEDVVPQIKVKRVHIWNVNPYYVGQLSYHITKHNATYNNIGIYWVNAKAWPADVVTSSRVYVTDSEYKNARLLLEAHTPICKESPNRELLPKVVVFDKSQLHGKCVKSGIYNTVDLGYFRFEVLVPNIHEISDYHYVDYKVHDGKDTIVEVTFYSEWGYLNN
ncbi:uncharacterized protein LOC103316980 [Nasonia vitripennis]|uniref:Uncharacterized protein n=1 Tax=Nasonia vitripennis TaxID=7425 RepID=A0A7M7H904_NASVI|nr:uncharacterized protein LOC103316980 [Nasonia vitripennis]